MEQQVSNLAASTTSEELLTYIQQLNFQSLNYRDATVQQQ